MARLADLRARLRDLLTALDEAEAALDCGNTGDPNACELDVDNAPTTSVQRCAACDARAVDATLTATRARLAEAEAEIARLRDDLRVNAAMLARQTDLARDAEVGHSAAMRVLRDVLASGVEHDDPRVGYVTMQVDRATLAAVRDAQDGHEEVKP